MNLSKYDTLVDCLADLRKMGYTEDYTIENNKLKSTDNDKSYAQDDLTVMGYHRFEGMTNPDDMSIVYAVESKDGQKGTIVNSFGIYASGQLAKFMDGVAIDEKAQLNVPNVRPEDLA